LKTGGRRLRPRQLPDAEDGLPPDWTTLTVTRPAETMDVSAHTDADRLLVSYVGVGEPGASGFLIRTPTTA
jgi:hypothetical protein